MTRDANKHWLLQLQGRMTVIFVTVNVKHIQSSKNFDTNLEGNKPLQQFTLIVPIGQQATMVPYPASDFWLASGLDVMVIFNNRYNDTNLQTLDNVNKENVINRSHPQPSISCLIFD